MLVKLLRASSVILDVQVETDAGRVVGCGSS